MLNKLTSISIALCFAVLAVAAVAPNASADGNAVRHFQLGTTDPEFGGDYMLDFVLGAHPTVAESADFPGVEADPGLTGGIENYAPDAGARIGGAPTIWVSAPNLVHFEMNGAWAVALTYEIVDEDQASSSTVESAVDWVTITIGVWDGNECQEFGLQTIDLADVDPTVTRSHKAIVGTVVLPDDSFAEPGQSICVALESGVPLELSNLTPSTLTSPTTPADLPVPNVGALVLLSIGGLMVSGVVYMRRF